MDGTGIYCQWLQWHDRCLVESIIAWPLFDCNGMTVVTMSEKNCAQNAWPVQITVGRMHGCAWLKSLCVEYMACVMEKRNTKIIVPPWTTKTTLVAALASKTFGKCIKFVGWCCLRKDKNTHMSTHARTHTRYFYKYWCTHRCANVLKTKCKKCEGRGTIHLSKSSHVPITRYVESRRKDTQILSWLVLLTLLGMKRTTTGWLFQPSTTLKNCFNRLVTTSHPNFNYWRTLK